MEGDLMLNLVSEGNFQPKSKRKDFGYIRNQRNRIKARRKFKETMHNERRIQMKERKLVELNSSPKSQCVSSEKPQRSDVNPDESKVKKLFSKEDIVKRRFKDQHKEPARHKTKRSLFAGNPSIPTVECPQIETQTVETMYDSSSLFCDLSIHPLLKDYIKEKMSLVTLTEVQSKALPVLLNKKDALIMSETGSGKTLTYALPVVQGIHDLVPPVTRTSGPVALVFVPTRELALQCFDVFQRLTLPVRRIVATCIIGGQKRKSEKARMRKGVNIIVSTPGRFIDHLQHTACLSLENIQWLVFDEADRLLDMGFQKAINEILTAIKEKSKFKPHVALLSATLTKGVEKLVELSLKDPVRIEVKPESKQKSEPTFVDPLTGLRLEKASLPSKLSQHVIIVPSKLRLVTLLAFINTHCIRKARNKILVFLSCRDSVTFHHDFFQKFKVPDYNPENSPIIAFQLHGGMTQQERTATIQKFRKIESGVIFCTDVAARGLDIPNVHWVVQYTSPGSPVEYIHRVGRTARAGHEGNALLFLTPAEVPYIQLLTTFDISVNELKFETVISDVLGEKEKKVQFFARMQEAKETASKVHRELEEFVSSRRSLKENAKKAFIAFVRAYATYPSALKSVFHVRNLHLGHVAKSFALQEAPTEVVLGFKWNIGRSYKHKNDTTPTAKNNSKNSAVKRKSNSILNKFDLLSEFSSGVGSNKKPKLG